jgi:hypothetical protein
MQLYRHIDENLFSLPRRDLVQQNRILINDSISINYNGFNIELWDIDKLNKSSNNNFKLMMWGYPINQQIINYDLQIINYQSDIEKIKPEYDNKINELETKYKKLENELSKKDKLNKRLVNILTNYKYHELNNVQKYNYQDIKEKMNQILKKLKITIVVIMFLYSVYLYYRLKRCYNYYF